jgi:hypothetical protein
MLASLTDMSFSCCQRSERLQAEKTSKFAYTIEYRDLEGCKGRFR